MDTRGLTRSRIRSLAGIVLLLLPAAAYGVGAFFARESGGKVSMPGARAFMHRSESREDLIIQVGFTGDAAEFGWVIAVPTLPTVRPADASIFEELRRICEPRIIQKAQPSKPTDSKKADQEPPPVQIQDFAVFTPDESTALVRWFHDNRYTVPAKSYEIIQDYSRRRWYFVAVNVRTSPAKNARWLQPLSITFQSRRASFPARFVILNETPIVTQLYVAADVITKAQGFAEAYTTGTPARTTYKLNEFPLFFGLVKRDCKLTELRGLLDLKKIDTDIVVQPK